jgi:HTH-type transcriptional regulator, competence development regulator
MIGKQDSETQSSATSAQKTAANLHADTAAFGPHVRVSREALAKKGETLSLRLFARELGIEPAYLSKIERGIFPPPSEEVILKIAARLGENPDRLLALAGKVASDIKAVILRRPELVGGLLRELDKEGDSAVQHLLRDVRDGEW